VILTIIPKIMERLVTVEQAAQKCYVERFNLKKLSELQVMKLRSHKGL
jgi:uncharacterized protein YhbP (UPF0306 family)